MSTVLGVLENVAKFDNQGHLIGAKPSLPQTNAPFSHQSVSSYLTFMRLVEDDALCRPVTLIVVSDGQPTPWNIEGGATLYERFRSIRRLLSVKTYIVAYTESVFDNPTNFKRVHRMACAASGADSIPSPCSGGNTFSNWDTCRDPDDPANGCAWLTSDADELTEALTQIIAQAIETNVPGGTPTLANDFQMLDANDPDSAQAAIQTQLEASTDVPQWSGHLTRSACTDEDPNNPGQLAEYCQNAIDLPPETEEEESFGPCSLANVWDAGECLAQTTWNDRRIYTHDADNNVFRISEPDGEPSAAFVSLVEDLNGQGKIQPPLSNDPQTKDAEIVAMAEWLLGRNMPDEW
jgi:hypothetical protein